MMPIGHTALQLFADIGAGGIGITHGGKGLRSGAFFPNRYHCRSWKKRFQFERGLSGPAKPASAAASLSAHLLPLTCNFSMPGWKAAIGSRSL